MTLTRVHCSPLTPHTLQAEADNLSFAAGGEGGRGSTASACQHQGTGGRRNSTYCQTQGEGGRKREGKGWGEGGIRGRGSFSSVHQGTGPPDSRVQLCYS